jgi:hypothetical protein
MSVILPTQDEALRQRLLSMFRIASETFEYTTSVTERDRQHAIIVEHILRLVEDRGYYKGTPSSIEEALNSGNGSYRP